MREYKNKLGLWYINFIDDLKDYIRERYGRKESLQEYLDKQAESVKKQIDDYKKRTYCDSNGRCFVDGERQIMLGETQLNLSINFEKKYHDYTIPKITCDKDNGRIIVDAKCSSL